MLMLMLYLNFEWNKKDLCCDSNVITIYIYDKGMIGICINKKQYY